MYDVMRRTRSRFKYALRQCKQNSNSIICDRMANNLCNKNDKEFWRDVKNQSNAKVPLPAKVDDVQGADNIVKMWKSHYEQIFTMVNDSKCNDSCNMLKQLAVGFTDDMIVSATEVQDIVVKLSNGKSPGPDKLTAEHLKFCHPIVHSILARLVTAMLVHGFLPESMLHSVIVPIIKNKNKSISDKNNYRPIALSNVCTKVLENVLTCFNEPSQFIPSNL